MLKALEKAVDLRNELAHGATLEESGPLHKWLEEMSGWLRQIYQNLLSLAHYALVAVDDLDYDDDDPPYRLRLRRLEGVSPVDRLIHLSHAKPRKKGRVYFAAGDFSDMVSLHPWVVLARCPLCSEQELFFYVSCDGDKIRYVTPDRGHGCYGPVPTKFLQAFADGTEQNKESGNQ